MRRLLKNTALLIAVVFAIISCERKPISDECLCTSTLAIPIDVDWSVSGVSLKNATVLFYNTSDGSLAYEHTYEHNDNDIQSYAYLPTGEYTAVVFNELRDEIQYLSCVGYDNLSTLKFESNSNEDPLRSRSTTRSYVQESGDLAVSVVDGIVITEDMIVEAAYTTSDDSSEETRTLSEGTRAAVESMMGVTPKKKNSTISISIHFINIYYARMPALVDLINLADGYYVYSDNNSSSSSTLQFTMGERVYDEGSYYDGTISATVTSFGTLTERSDISGYDESNPVTVDVLFQLIDDEFTELNRVMTVTNYITHSEMEDGSIYLSIDVSCEEALPAVEPSGSSGDSGFGSSVNDWSDVVDVPLS